MNNSVDENDNDAINPFHPIRPPTHSFTHSYSLGSRSRFSNNIMLLNFLEY